MVLWQEEAYTRTDPNGNTISFVRLRLLVDGLCTDSLLRNNTSKGRREPPDGNG